jgi:chloramphenicol O-acetyltransferase type A
MQPAAGRKIDVDTWDRRTVFNFFRTFTEPYHGICVRVDCTHTYHYAKQQNLSVFLSLLHRSLVASHLVENLRTRIVAGDVWLYDRINGGSTVDRPNGTIGFGYYPFHEDVRDFVRSASLEVERVRQRDDLERRAELNLIRYSVLPWLDFTSLSHARDLSREDSAPRITYGKITEAAGRRSMPVSIHVHHALADGLHVGQFVDHFQNLLDNPESLPLSTTP